MICVGVQTVEHHMKVKAICPFHTMMQQDGEEKAMVLAYMNWGRRKLTQMICLGMGAE